MPPDPDLAPEIDSHAALPRNLGNASNSSNAAAQAESRPGGATWPSYAVAFGATSIIIGAIWDISWHSTIGRDTFWTPAHIAIYLGGVIGGLTGGWLVLEATFWGSAAARAAAVRVWGFRGPVGAWVLILGAFAMLISAPFDDWWHNAYGLDVEILSPPHAVLATGVFLIGLGAVFLLVSQQNRAAAARRDLRAGAGGWKTSALLCAYTFGLLLTMHSIFLTEFSYPNQHRTPTFYTVSCISYPLFLVAAARVSSLRWGATLAAASYMAINLIMLWILPLFPGKPLLAPIYNPVDHMVPPPFPHLLIVPAIGIDLVQRWVGSGGGWLRDVLMVLVAPAVFLALFLAAQWHFSEFLISDLANNRVFAGTWFHAYFYPVGDWIHQFWKPEDPVTARKLLPALGLGFLSAGAGLLGGNWMARVKR